MESPKLTRKKQIHFSVSLSVLPVCFHAINNIRLHLTNLDTNQMTLITGFSYDGAGPDAFFWAGKSGKPDTVKTTDPLIITYPPDGKSYSYEDENVPILKKFT